VASMAKTGPAAPAWSMTSRCNWSRPGRRTGSDSGGTTAPASPVLSQTRLLTLPGSSDHQRRCRQRLVQQAHDNLPSSAETSSGRSRRHGVNGYQLERAAREGGLPLSTSGDCGGGCTVWLGHPQAAFVRAVADRAVTS
jgi:hypothetical protein